MFFRNYFISVANIIDAKFKAYESKHLNPADKGELGELFIKELLKDALDDNFKIFRGGKIVNNKNVQSKQMDIVLCGKQTLALFGDKGIYPVETVFGTVSVTATLNEKKLLDCCEEFASIPKQGFEFTVEKYIGDEHLKSIIDVYENIPPYNIVFAYKGVIKDWNDFLIKFMLKNDVHHSLLPDMIIVNKVGYVEKILTLTEDGTPSIKYEYFTYDLKNSNYGIPFSKMLYHLYNLSGEQYLLRPVYGEYFNKDLF